MRRRLSLLALLPLAAVLTGCPFDNEQGDGMGCTREFATVRVRVVDAGGTPTVPTSATVTRASGQSLVCPASDDLYKSGCVVPIRNPPAGPIEIELVHDGIEVSRTGETIRVGAAAGALRGTAEVVVRNDGCHVAKVSGPDTLVLR